MVKKYFVPVTYEEAKKLRKEYGDRAKYLLIEKEYSLANDRADYDVFIDLRLLGEGVCLE